MCEHVGFRAQVNVHRLPAEEGGPVNAISADIRVWCADCGQPMQFIGPVVGDLADELAVSRQNRASGAPHVRRCPRRVRTAPRLPDAVNLRTGEQLMGQENVGIPSQKGEDFDNPALGRILNNMRRLGIKQLLVEINEQDGAKVPVTLTYRKVGVDPEPITVTLVH